VPDNSKKSKMPALSPDGSKYPFIPSRP